MTVESFDQSSNLQRETRSSLVSRQRQDRNASGVFISLSVFPAVILVVLFIALLFRAWPILRQIPLADLLLGQTWKPSLGEFGFMPFIMGSIWVTAVAMIFAIPVSLFTAIYLSEYARGFTRTIIKPIIDILAGIPSVVYGLWGVLVIVPWVQNTLRPFINQTFPYIGLFQSKNPTGYSILSGGLVLAVMVMPFIIAISYEIMRTVPKGLHEASLAVGATRWQTVRYVIIPKTITGLVAGIVMGTSRAFGETIAVLMVIGNVPNMPVSIFDAAYPLPALIANNYGEMMSIPMYDAALLGAALLLLVIVLIFNLISAVVLRRMMLRSMA
jgi:phosphate transport system permease protein